jgi:hypothetical protein
VESSRDLGSTDTDATATQVKGQGAQKLGMNEQGSAGLLGYHCVQQ